jgi:hypothetical protein
MPKRTDITDLIKNRGAPAVTTTIQHCWLAIWSLLARRLFFVTVVGLSAYACTESVLPTDIGPNFQVQIASEGKVVEGLQIELSTVPPPAKDEEPEQDSRIVAVVRTDSQGLSVFRNVRPGLYYVEVKHPASPVSIEIRVLKHPPKTLSAVITLQWPDRNFLAAQWASGFLNGSVKTDRGILEDLRDPVYRPVAGAKVSLWTLISHELIGSQVTGDAGSFDFPRVTSGDYFLQIEAPNFPHDYVPVTIDPRAEHQRFDLSIGDAICGALAVGFTSRTKN